MKRLSLNFSVAILVGCTSLSTQYPDDDSFREFKTLFKDFSKTKNYELTFKLNKPLLNNVTKVDYSKTKEQLLGSAFEEIISFIYSLPMGERKFIKTNCLEDFELDDFTIPCGFRNEKGQYIQGYSPMDYISKYKKLHNENPPYSVESVPNNDVNFEVTSRGDYSTILEWKVRAVGVNRFNFPTTSIANPYFHLKKHRLIFAKQSTHHDSITKILGMDIQHIAIKKEGERYFPIINGSEELDRFIQTHSFSKIPKKEFQIKIKDQIFSLIEKLNLQQGDQRDLIHYLNRVYLSGYLFFGQDYGPSTDGFNQIADAEFNTFLKDENRRRRMLGLVFVAYSKFRVSEDKSIIQVEVDLERMFKEISFVAMNGHMEQL